MAAADVVADKIQQQRQAARLGLGTLCIYALVKAFEERAVDTISGLILLKILAFLAIFGGQHAADAAARAPRGLRRADVVELSDIVGTARTGIAGRFRGPERAHCF